MPSATQELRDEWDGPDPTKAFKHLEDRGYTLTNAFEWVVPPGIVVSEKDCSAIDFLMQEFDYGGFHYDVSNLEDN